MLIECCKPTVPAVLDHFNALLSLLHDNLTCVLMTSWNHGTSMTHQTSATRVLGDFKSFLDFFDPLLDFLILRYSVGHFLTVNVFPKFRHVEYKPQESTGLFLFFQRLNWHNLGKYAAFNGQPAVNTSFILSTPR